jgi:hypothetical protein
VDEPSLAREANMVEAWAWPADRRTTIRVIDWEAAGCPVLDRIGHAPA